MKTPEIGTQYLVVWEKKKLSRTSPTIQWLNAPEIGYMYNYQKTIE